MDAQQNEKRGVEEPRHGPHYSKLHTSGLRDSFNYLEGETSYVKPEVQSWEQLYDETTSPTPAVYNPVKCDLCYGEFDDELTLKHHITSVHNEANNIFILEAVSLKCTKCSFEAMSREDLQNHALLHDEDKKLACDLCGCSFFTNSSLKTHLKSHAKKKVDKKSKRSLKKKTKNPYKLCPTCGFKTKYRGNLTVHLRRHTGKKPFHCDLCDYKCSEKSYLILHIRTHTGEKPYHCNLCDFKSRQKYKLTEHTRTHTGNKPFQCNLCHFKTTRKESLNNHNKIHTGEKPFHCHLCDYKGSRKYLLSLHIRTHH